MWERSDHKISQWGRIPFNDKLECTLVTPAATAYRPGLYLLEHVGDAEAQQVEKDFFGQIENEAGRCSPS